MAASAGHEVKGKVAVLHGTVKAISPDGMVRVLTVNSLIYADDKIITGGDGSISIVFDSVPPTQLDLGRMSEVQITEDVYGGHVTPGAAADAAAEQEAIQSALLQGDQPLQLDATAAGGELSAGGGHPVFVVNPNWSAVTPESGAETRGITWGGIEETRFDPTEEQVSTNVPTAGAVTVNLYDSALNQSVSGPLVHDFGADGGGAVTLLNAVIPDGLGLSVTMNTAGTEMFVYQDGTLVMTVTVTDTATGQCTVVQNNALIHPADADESSLIIHYQVTDGTDDTATGTMNINIFDDFPSVSANGSPQFYDANVGTTQIIATGDLGHDFGADVPGSISYLATGAPSGYTYVKDGSNLLVKYGGADGTTVLTLTLDANGSYTVAQNAAAHHPAGSDSMDFNISYQVVDADGDTSVGTLMINVVDSAPVAHVDTGSANEGATLTVDPAAGVLPNDFFGADGKVIANGGVVGVAAGSDASNPVAGNVDTGITGQYGTLTLHADGSYTYVSSANAITQNVSDTFVYTIQDGDGDLSTTTLTINLTDSGLSATTDSVTVNEAALDMVKDGLDLAAGTVDGSDPKSTAETVQGTLADNAIGGFGTLTYSLVGSDAGTYGKIAINADGTYTYTLTKPIIGPTADDGTNPETGDTFTYKVADANGNYVTNTITVTVTDDVPTAHIDSGSGNEGMTINVDAAAGVLANDVAGADGITLVGVAAGSDTSNPVAGNVGQGISGQYGSLTLHADGSYTYESTANAITENVSDTFVYTIKDGDGDLSTTTLTIDLTPSDVAAGSVTGTVNEAALDKVLDAHDLAVGTVTGTLGTGSAAETLYQQALEGSGSSGPLSYALVGAGGALVTTLTTAHGVIQIDPVNGTYTYTLTSPVILGSNSEPTDTFTYQVTDADGNFAQSTITINALDDVPTPFTADSVSIVDSASGATATDDLNFVPGADGFGSVIFKEFYNGNSFVNITEGTPALDANGHQLTYGGSNLYYYLDGTGTVLSAKTSATAEAAFTVELSDDGTTYTITTHGDITNGTEIHVTSLEGAVKGGNAAIDGILDVQSQTLEDILLTTSAGKTVNTSKDWIGISDGQSIGVNEGIKISFVNDLSVTKSGNDWSYNFNSGSLAGYNETNMYQQHVHMAQGSGDSINVTLTAYAAAMTAGYASSVLYDKGAALTLTDANSDIAVYDNLENEIDSTLYKVTYSAGSVTIEGLQDGWEFKLTTENPFTSIQIDGAADTDNFKLGLFSYGEEYAGDPIQLSYHLTGTDADSDPATGTLNATLYHDAGTGSQLSSMSFKTALTTIDGTNHADNLFGTAGDDHIMGHDGKDVLMGGRGDDTLEGGKGADTLVGGPGHNTLSGGAGADIFKITQGETAKILDFKSSEGDKVVLDFSLGNHYKITTASDEGMAKVLVESGGITTTISTNIGYESVPTPGGELDTLLGQLDPNPHH